MKIDPITKFILELIITTILFTIILLLTINSAIAEPVTLFTTKNLNITAINHSINITFDNQSIFYYITTENNTYNQDYNLSINLTTDIENGTIHLNNITTYECDIEEIIEEIDDLQYEIRNLGDDVDAYGEIEFNIKEAFVQRMQNVESNILQRIKTENEQQQRIDDCNTNLIQSKTQEGIATSKNSELQARVDEMESQESYYIYGFLGLLLICVTLSFKEKIMELGNRGYYR